MTNRSMPANISGVVADTWSKLSALADNNGVVVWTPELAKGENGIAADDVELLAAVQGCDTVDQADGTKMVTLRYAESAPEVVDTPTPGEVAAAGKKTEFAGDQSREDRREE